MGWLGLPGALGRELTAGEGRRTELMPAEGLRCVAPEVDGLATWVLAGVEGLDTCGLGETAGLDTCGLGETAGLDTCGLGETAGLDTCVLDGKGRRAAVLGAVLLGADILAGALLGAAILGAGFLGAATFAPPPPRFALATNGESLSASVAKAPLAVTLDS